jgi:hypothetical protein
MSVEVQPPSWHGAATLAAFAFYEPANAARTWAGGFSGDGQSIEIIGLFGDDEMSVRTERCRQLPSSDDRVRVDLLHLTWTHIMFDHTDVTLPLSMSFVSEERHATIDGEPHTASGILLTDVNRWIGRIDLGDVTLTISTTASQPIALRTCADPPSLTVEPPPGR